MPTRRDISTGLITLAACGLGATRRAAIAQVSPGAASQVASASELRLVAAPAILPIFGKAPDGSAGKLTPGLAFSGSSPGPVHRIRLGDEVSVRLVNQLSEPLSLHWHGLRGPNAVDGVAGLTGEPVPPGSEGVMRFRPPDAGLLLYRPMVVGRSAELTDRGLYGALIVEEANPPPVDMEIVALIDDARLGEDGAHQPFGLVEDTAFGGRLGNLLLVDGKPAPLVRTVPPGARVRLRLANVCNARAFRVRFDEMKASVIAVDGQPGDSFEPLRASLPLAPGTRYDIVLDMPDTPGRTGTVVGVIGTGLDLIRITTDAAAPARRDLPPLVAVAANPLLPAEIKLNLATRADVVMDGGAKPGADGKPAFTGDPTRAWTINGVAGDGRGGAKPIVSVKRGTPVVLALINRTSWLQTLHLHGHVCRMLHGLDDGWEPYWLDTISIAAGQTLRVAFVADNPGRWLIGSTVLERLDTGMSCWFEVM